MPGFRLLMVVGMLLLAGAGPLAGQVVHHPLVFPDLPGYQTLVCDFHMHTVFSDAGVWPTVRVEEAARTGLDAIALTDHIELQKHKEDLKVDLNRSYELAQPSAGMYRVLVIHAAEITRDTPPGHFNALFLNDVQPLKHDDFVEQIKQANAQGAFVFWNHQGWKGSERGRWLEVHEQILANHWLQGMEICNGDEYYPEAHQACLDRNLTILGNSDIHGPEIRAKNEAGNHRTTTLVFAKERSVEAIHEALVARRTAVWYQEQILGRPEILEPFFQACLQIVPPHVRGKDFIVFELVNRSDVDLVLQRTAADSPGKLAIPARGSVFFKLKSDKPQEPRTIECRVMNFHVAPEKPLVVTLEIPGA